MSEKWDRWLLQTADSWQDLSSIVKEVGIAKIDHEHKRMIDYMIEINRLLLSLESDFTIETYEEQKRLIESFHRYVKWHCSSEEKFIKKYNISGLDLQEKEHSNLISIIENIIIQFQSGRVNSAFGHRTELLEEIVKHINNVDYKVFNINSISKQIIHAHDWNDINEFIRLVHIPIIDKQHKLLTEMIIRLLQYLKLFRDGNITSLQEDKLVEVIEFAKIHFRTEEEIIKKHVLQELDTQLDQHQNFIDFLIRCNDGINSGDYQVINNMEEELLLWWVRHINIYDYKTFRKNPWLETVLEKSKSREDVYWLFTKLGIEEVDNDHSRFIDILFDNFAVFDNKSHSTIEDKDRAITKLYEYAKDHFHREEKIMVDRKVMDKDQHFLEHRSILRQLKEFIKLNRSNQVDFSEAFKQKILYTWVMHINDTDTATFGANYD